MIRDRHASTAVLCLLAAVTGCAPDTGANGDLAGADTIWVAPPTGDTVMDRRSIGDALALAEPGTVIAFAPGLYRIGPLIRLGVPGITLLGHPDGTVIRGCDPDQFVGDPSIDAFACHGLELAAPRQTILDLVIEYAWHGLFVGCCFPRDMVEFESGASEHWAQPGGHVIRGNTFRYSPNGLRVIGEAEEPVVIEGNRFVDVYHAIGVNGGPVRFVDNEMVVEEPERVPVTHYPGDVINVLAFAGRAYDREDHTSCRGNVIEGNTITGYPDGIAIQVWGNGESCRDNVIRNNRIELGRVRFRNGEMLRVSDPSDSSLVGVPIRLVNMSDDPAGLAGNLIQGNDIISAEGLGVLIDGAADTRVVGNRFLGVSIRQPFPGNSIRGGDERWQHANGSAIWISERARQTRVGGNVFLGIERSEVVDDGSESIIEIDLPTDPGGDGG